MNSTPLLLLLAICLLPSLPAQAARFSCNATAPRAATCQALVGYAPTNSTTLGEVRALFQLRSLRGLLAANALPLSTPASAPVAPPSTLRVRLPCLCSGGIGASFRGPIYKVRAGDSLDAIARTVFAGLVTYQEIAAANNVTDVNKIDVGQQLWIPLPCSCDPVGGKEVVHYAYVVVAGSSVSGIAAQFGTTEETVMAVNGIADPKSLLAGQVLDIPLRACSSSISNSAIDRNLRVPNGSYILTANNCIMCSCSSTYWQLDCQPTQVKSSSVCPVAKCGDMYLGNSSSTSSCESTTCAYAGYTNSTSFTILTNTTTQSSCNGALSPLSQSAHSSAAFGLEWRKSKWMELLVYLHVVLLCLGYFHCG